MASRVPSTLPHLPPFSGVTWFQYSLKLVACEGLCALPRNSSWPVAMGGPVGVNGGGGGSVEPGKPIVEIVHRVEHALHTERELVEVEPVFAAGNLKDLRQSAGGHHEARDRRLAAIEGGELHPFPHSALRRAAADDLVTRQRVAHGPARPFAVIHPPSAVPSSDTGFSPKPLP